ncbi:hypothetical protein [Corallococcus exiguus]|uniref:Lipoprotein n=1 Tax=Corallococcus exiguus TaxID=83462 RepID=A0A7X4Y5B0_9BACT|nr:hypothetical protein [Corallococcus exiguus]NBC38816.1 hypothetical protein [Corallococcus exiguus]TNV61547.1 hypothetical protein FH620_20885 [Corallococcus exiguus]
MKTTRLPLLLSLVLPLAACSTARATSFALPMERATECRQLCEQIDMKLSAVVIIMNSAGCVCEPKPAEGTTNAALTGAAAASGGAIIRAAADAAQQSSNNTAPSNP